MSTDGEIIRRSRAHPPAFGELYDRHAAMLHRYSARRAGASIADDIVAETFLIAFERRASFDGRDDAGPWLFGIATNLLRRHYRAEAQVLRLAARSFERDGADHDRADERLDARRRTSALADALRRMPARDRDVLLLYAWADLGYDEIALALDVPVGTVRSRLNRARRVLRDAAHLEQTDEPTETGRDHGRADTAPRPS